MRQIYFTLLVVVSLPFLSTITFACSRSKNFGEPCGDYQKQNLQNQRPVNNYYGGQSSAAVGYPYQQQQQIYQQQTIISSQDDCDTSKFLRCDQLTRTCRCPDVYKYYWDTYQTRCYIKVGYTCTETFGGLSEAKYSHGCGTNSYCNPGLGTCDCRPLYKTNYDYTGCSLNNGSKVKVIKYQIILIFVFIFIMI